MVLIKVIGFRATTDSLAMLDAWIDKLIPFERTLTPHFATLSIAES